jgi:hypothetical protein
VHDVTIREDESVGRKNKSRAGTFAASLPHLNVYDRRFDLLDRADHRA